eukprot:COSAG06_NODE_784_length_12328_cov_4.921416_16_plen_63_part_00
MCVPSLSWLTVFDFHEKIAPQDKGAFRTGGEANRVRGRPRPPADNASFLNSSDVCPKPVLVN